MEAGREGWREADRGRYRGEAGGVRSPAVTLFSSYRTNTVKKSA